MNRNIKFFLFSDILNQLGSGMLLSTIAWVILDHGGQNAEVGVAFSVDFGLGLLTSLFGVLLVDRLARKRLILLINVFRACMIGLGYFFLNTFEYSLYSVFLLSASNGIGWNLYFPATKALLQEITDDSNRLGSNSMAEVAMQIGLFSAGGLGGVVYRHLGFNTVMMINIITFFVSTGLVSLIRVPQRPLSLERKAGPWSELSEGFRFLAQRPAIFLLGICIFIPFVGARIASVSLPGFVMNVLHQSADLSGVITGCYGVGAFLAGTVIASFSNRMDKSRLTVILFGFFSAMAFLMFLNNQIFPAFVLTLLFGFCGAGIKILMYTRMMKVVNAEFMGRSMLIWNCFGILLQIGGVNTAVYLMDSLGSNYGYLALCVTMALGLCLYLLSSGPRKHNIGQWSEDGL